MEKRELSTGPAFKAGNIVLIPVVETAAQCRNLKTTMLISGWKKVTAIAIISGTEKRVIRMSGEEIRPENLEKEFPGLTLLPDDDGVSDCYAIEP